MHAQTRLNIQVNTMAKRKACNVLLISFPTSVIFAQNGPRASCKDFTLDGSAKCWLFLAASHKNNFLAVSAGVLGLPCGVNEAPCGVCGVALWMLGVTGVRVWGPVPKPARKVAAMSGAGRFRFLGSCDNTWLNVIHWCMANHLPPNKHTINQNYKQYSLRDSITETAAKKPIMNHASEILTKIFATIHGNHVQKTLWFNAEPFEPSVWSSWGRFVVNLL